MDRRNKQTESMPRRDFLKKVVAAGGATVGLGLLRGKPAAAQANERINIGMIGVGGRGSSLIGDLLSKAQKGANIAIIGCCDVWDVRAQRAAQRAKDAGFECKSFRDYREMLQLPDLDAVVIATPDHWHAKQSIDSMKAGKDVYCEKPMTLYWEQAKEVSQVAKATQRVFQCGAGSGSDGRWWTAGDIVKQGGIGPLVWSQAGVFRNDPSGDWNWGIMPADPNKDLDWDLWLGSEFGLAPKIPYDPERYSRFRKYWDYSGGLATDLIYHAYAHLMMGITPQFPYRVLGGGTQPVHNLKNDNREVPTCFFVVADFPSQHSVFLMSTQESEDGFEDLIRGQKASLTAGGPGVIVRVQRPFRKELKKLAGELECYKGAQIKEDSEGVTEIQVPNRYNFGDHMDNWLNCIRTREQPTLNAERAYYAMLPIALSVLSYRQGKVIFFDPKTEQVVDKPPELQ